MKSNRIKQAIDAAYTSVDVSDGLYHRILQKTVHHNNNHVDKPTKHKRRPLAAILAACLCVLLLSVPVLGSTSESYNRMLALFSTEFAQLLMPVKGIASAEDNGIEIKVVSAVADEYNLLLELQIKDIVGGRLPDPKDNYINLDGNISSGTYVSVTSLKEKQNLNTLTLYWYCAGKDAIDANNIFIQFSRIFQDTAYSIDGIWELSFSVETTKNRPINDITVGDQQFSDISVSAFSINMGSVDDNQIDLAVLDIELALADGTVITCNAKQTANTLCMLSQTSSDGYARVSVFFGTVIDVDSIESVAINGVETMFI